MATEQKKNNENKTEQRRQHIAHMHLFLKPIMELLFPIKLIKTTIVSYMTSTHTHWMASNAIWTSVLFSECVFLQIFPLERNKKTHIFRWCSRKNKWRQNKRADFCEWTLFVVCWTPWMIVFFFLNVFGLHHGNEYLVHIARCTIWKWTPMEICSKIVLLLHSKISVKLRSHSKSSLS